MANQLKIIFKSSHTVHFTNTSKSYITTILKKVLPFDLPDGSTGSGFGNSNESSDSDGLLISTTGGAFDFPPVRDINFF